MVGGGTAGLVSAVGAAGLGARVALVERHRLGGDCLNTGCVPSKALIRTGRALKDARSAGQFGVTLQGRPAVDFQAAMARMRTLRVGLAPHDSASRLAGLGVDVFLGRATFLAPNTVGVGEARLRFRRAILASGARAAVPPIPGLEEAGYLTSDTVFSLEELPRRLLVVGAGPIGCELAQAFSRFGSDVTLLTDTDRVLPREDPDAAAVVAAALASDGVTSHLEATVLRAGVSDDGSFLVAEVRGRERRFYGDAILIATGRSPRVEDLSLEAAGVRATRSGVVVDDFLRTTNRAIYAAGDVTGLHVFTHAADAMARIAVQNALFFGRKRVSQLVMPSCVYTDPELAHVGLAAAAAQHPPDTLTLTVPLSSVDRAVLDGTTDGFARLHVTRRGTILGATLVSPHAGDLISEISLLMQSRATATQLAATIHPYPTLSEVWKRLADEWNRTRLTPAAKAILSRFLTWLR